MKTFTAQNPAPHGVQTQVTAAPRSPREISRPENFTAANGARIEATIQLTAEGSQASFGLYMDFGFETHSMTNVQLFATDQEALAWLDNNARSRGFVRYSLDRRIE